MQVARDRLVLHLSEHHGDGSPGAYVPVDVHRGEALHAELCAEKDPYGRPGFTMTSHRTPQLTRLNLLAKELYLGEPEPTPAQSS